MTNERTLSSVPVDPTGARPPLPAALDRAVALCREALWERFAGFCERVPSARLSYQEWFELVRSIPEYRPSLAILRRIKSEAAAAGMQLPAGAVEQYALLNAALAAAPRVPYLSVDVSVKRQFCWTFEQVAYPPKPLQKYLDCDRWGFYEVAQIITQRRFPAGQHHWEVGRAARSCLLRLDARGLPRVMAEVLRGFGGFAPVAGLHLNVWRARPQLILESEGCRSLYRLAKSLELQPDIRGVQGTSWLHSKAVGEVSPHLSWMRDLFVENGAFTADMELATPETGFVVGSAQRQKLYEEGKFRPAVTLLLWRREDVLDWARRHPQYADDAEEASLDAPSVRSAKRPAFRAPAAAPRRNGTASAEAPKRRAPGRRLTWRGGLSMLRRAPGRYALLVLATPSLLAAAAVGLVLKWWGALAALPATTLFMWLLHLLFVRRVDPAGEANRNSAPVVHPGGGPSAPEPPIDRPPMPLPLPATYQGQRLIMPYL